MIVRSVPSDGKAALFVPNQHVKECGFFSRTFEVEVVPAAGADFNQMGQDSLSRSVRGSVEGSPSPRE